jgi:hypothetical protein
VLILPALTHSRVQNLQAIASLFVFLLFLFTPLSWAQQHDMSNMPGMSGTNHSDMHAPAVPEDPRTVAERLADKRESEFNHHLAGLFVLFAGTFILAQDHLGKRWTLARYVWPMCFLAAGLFLLVFSDTEIWPFGPQTPWYAITHSVEDLQHKTFAIILLVVGYVEFQKARGRYKARWTAWFFPIVSGAGAILLLFHVHSGNMEAPHAMETMEHIQQQHRWFATAGLGVAMTNLLAEIPQKWQQVFRKVWPAWLIALGVLLTLYTE